MDTSAVNINVTVDDFDSVLSYPDQSVWTTPDPSSSSFNVSDSPYWMGTYHLTNTVNASVGFNFTGPAIYIYGQIGPEFGSYSVALDNNTIILSAYASSNDSSPSLLYGASNLTYSQHTLVLTNVGGSNGGGNALLFDYLQTTAQLAPAGATVSNTTIEENNSTLTYVGEWDTNQSDNFSGGGSSYTQADGASVTLNFHGSAVYVFGDKKNDHGLYDVVLDNGTVEIFDGISGCGGAFGTTCEQMKPTLAYFASNLDESEHSLSITNVAGVNNSFFDLDSIVITVPSTYAPRSLDSGSGKSGSTSSSSSSSSASSPSLTTSDNGAASLAAANPFLVVLLVLLLTRFLRY